MLIKSICLKILGYSRDNTSIKKKTHFGFFYFSIQVNKLVLTTDDKLADGLVATKDTKTSFGIVLLVRKTLLSIPTMIESLCP